ncbi:MAG: glycosyltransferase family 39 protein [Candidatus Binatota bacterium]|nr:glycosyltransferase family 39 protein [Candidatus Binatota bacterium]
MIRQNHFPFILVIISFLLFFFALGSRDFWTPVEPRYGEIVRVMFSKGEWIVPTVNGGIYTDKPILFFWLALIASNLCGSVSEWTVRFPAALAGVGFVLSTYFFGRDFFGPRIGFIAAVILATSVRVVWEARWAHVDMVFCCWFLLSIYFAARTFLGKDRGYGILFAYACMGLAVLTKGFIGVVLPGLVFGAFMLVRRDWRMIAAAKLHLGIPIFLLVTVPWFYLVQQATDGRWLSEFIYIHHVQRYTAGAGHRQPVYYYLATLPADFLPWTVFAIPALIARWPYRQALQDVSTQLCLCWFLTILLFFTISATKRELYLLPLLPTAALMVACYLDSRGHDRAALGAYLRWFTAGCFTLLALGAFLVPAAAWWLRPDALLPLLPATLVLTIGGALVAAYLLQRALLRAMAAIVTLTTLSIFAAALWIFPYLENSKSPRPFALKIKKFVPVTVPLYIYADTMHNFNYYAEREVIPVLTSPAVLENLLKTGQSGFLLVRERDFARLPMLSRAWIIASEGKGRRPRHLVEFNR